MGAPGRKGGGVGTSGEARRGRREGRGRDRGRERRFDEGQIEGET